MSEEVEERWRESTPLWNSALKGECFALVSFDLSIGCAVCDVAGNDADEQWMEIGLYNKLKKRPLGEKNIYTSGINTNYWLGCIEQHIQNPLKSADRNKS